jgi:Tfp pilus assembly PilM family ATPase
MAKPVGRILAFNLAEGIVLPVRAVAVSIEKGGVSIVAGSRFLSRIGVRKALTYGFDDGKQAGPERLASAVSLGLRELGVAKNDVALVIPKEWAVVRIVTLPLAAKEDLADVVAYELDRLTPFSADNAYHDFRFLGEEDGMLKLLLAATRGDLVDQYLDVLRGEGIRVERLVVGVSGLATLCAYGCRSPESICVEVGSNAFQGTLTRSGALSSFFGGPFPRKTRGRG